VTPRSSLVSACTTKHNAYVSCRANFHEDVPAILAVWVPAQFINFGFSPMWFRVPFVATVSAFWTGYVSVTRGAVESPSSRNDERQEDHMLASCGPASCSRGASSVVDLEPSAST
jgi:hypothetical protein